MSWIDLRFALAWALTALMAVAAWHSAWAAYAVGVAIQVSFAWVERVVPWWRSPPARAASNTWFVSILRVHVALQAALLATGVAVAQRHAALANSGLEAVAGLVALGIGVGSITGAQGITFAHELGHSRSRMDRVLAWLLMSSVLYAHFMVEHYRGHHVRAATAADPATARRGESLYEFLPRTLVGSWRSAWALEGAQRRRLGQSWLSSPLVAATVVQLALLVGLGIAFGTPAIVFWLVQAAYAVFLLETINYIEHYGLERCAVADGKHEPFGMQHAWNADHALTNCVIVNLQRHSDHHLHAWKPYATLEALPGPQLPTGYAGCILLAMWPSRWFAAMEPRFAARAA